MQVSCRNVLTDVLLLRSQFQALRLIVARHDGVPRGRNQPATLAASILSVLVGIKDPSRALHTELLSNEMH